MKIPKIEKKELETDLPYKSAVTLQGIHSKASEFCTRDTCSSMFVATVFLTARRWNSLNSH